LWERGEAYTWFWWRNLSERDHSGDLGVDGKIILRCTFRKWVVGKWTGSIWLRIGTGECGYKLSDYTKYGEFLD
jgi:hypothetical protein